MAQVHHWAPAPSPDAENPLLASVDEADWPATPAGRHYDAVREAAALVESAIESAAERAAERRTVGRGARAGGPGPEDRALIEAWRRDAGLLLAERAQRRADGAAIPVQLPPGSRCPRWSRWPATRPSWPGRSAGRCPGRRPGRPVRAPPSIEWLEQRYGQQRLIDDADLFEPDADDPARGEDLSQLRARFEHSEWADRWPQAVEVPFETLVGDRLVRGRIDAVFADSPDGGFDVVDWKTGRPPASEAERHVVSVQLAAYRLAWSALARVPVTSVRAAFHYVADGVTVRPADLLDEAGLTALIEQVPTDPVS